LYEDGGIVIVIANSIFLQRPQKRSRGNYNSLFTTKLNR